MAEFADRMTSFTDRLRESIRSREEALSGVHAATHELLDDARSFLGHVADENQQNAAELRASLASHRAAFQERVAEMRHAHQDALQAMRSELSQTLSESRRTRHDSHSRMFHAFRQARHDLATDLRSAANAWRAFAASR